ncbi:hypothetical protein BBO99_00001088 [Phytophthora kernoviae]|uniref:t-SNARE coiled-coil homology domain-containing protein n=2 Tax=Phytophthora kernoviae TaxID=325452 RepID=A0A3R7JYI8_9STRA|nr:hypothetical protein G195_004015 [Phytophthora kernoviae 00238/432]KAG2532385.1 hypothetical protein JM16_000368 [Phytophthora kernoviae]KAG2533412.1 hypothetical protein JM18_000285 [Phytophthora kernoviae]RLN06758.1 hypothetical protein BBI17_001059 [Phytophthora kernoviae]RLN84740.1 hypothetical protein BBO99_00001088 [Phytophthora kernoviae]
MSATAWASWLDRLESARGQEQVLANKIRSGNAAAIGTSVFALQQSVSRLKRDFDQLKRSSTTAVTKQEIERRERLLGQLEQDQKDDLDVYNNRKNSQSAVSPGAADAPARLLSMQNQIMKDQDQQLELIGQGVSNLHNYSMTVKDETELHVRLLNEIDDDVSRATDGLESESARAHRSDQGEQQVETLSVPMENSRPQPPSAEQQQKLREAYTSPMRPTQYTRSPEDPSEQQKEIVETPREAAARKERERLSMEQVLLGRRWVFHCTSPLFHFHREQLSEYAHDLVKALRAAALRACGQQFGYSVSIRNTDTFVAFQIREERDRRNKAKRPTLPGAPTKREAPERTGGFVLYFPAEGEQRAPRKGREKQQVLLLRGNEELMRWVCSWLQRRFQCVVSTHVVRIQQLNLKRLARNWVVASLMSERMRPSQVKRELDRRGNQEEEEVCEGAMSSREPPRAPLQIKYRATKEEAVVRTYTLTVPWSTLRRLLEQTNSVASGDRTSTYVPELIELTERLYVDALPVDLSTYEIVGVAMQEVAADPDGGVEFYSMELVHTVLFSLLELLAVQDIATTSRPETTL